VGCAVGQRPHERFGDITDMYGCEAGAGSCQRQHPPCQTQQRRKSPGQGIFSAEDHRRSKDRPLKGRGGAHQLLGLTLAAQVMAGAALGIGVERAHVQQPPHAGIVHRLQDAGGELDVGVPEPGAAMTALVEYSHQVNDHIAAVEAAAQKRRVIHIADPDLDARERAQLLAACGAA